MTRREFDAATRRNHGAPMASDTHAAYRWLRMLPDPRTNADRLAVRAMARAIPGALPTLAVGSRFRAPTHYRLRGCLPC